VVWVFYSSLKTKAEFTNNIINLPAALDFGNYLAVFQTTPMLTFILNSLRNTAISIVFILLISFVMGYFFSRFKFRGSKALHNFFMFGLLVPVHALLVPVYLIYKNIGFTDQWYSLILPYVAFGVSFPIFLVESYLRGIPTELEEAASIDGCTFTGTLFTIILPAAMPVMATVAIMQFFSCWNEFPFSLVLTSKEALRTVPLGLTYFQSQHDVNYPRMMAAMMCSLIPVAIIYFTFSAQIIKGVAAGAVKG
jgi:raffinose/stachyose/melibiose transport system permease protein